MGKRENQVTKGADMLKRVAELMEQSARDENEPQYLLNSAHYHVIAGEPTKARYALRKAIELATKLKRHVMYDLDDEGHFVPIERKSSYVDDAERGLEALSASDKGIQELAQALKKSQTMQEAIKKVGEKSLRAFDSMYELIDTNEGVLTSYSDTLAIPVLEEYIQRRGPGLPQIEHRENLFDGIYRKHAIQAGYRPHIDADLMETVVKCDEKKLREYMLTERARKNRNRYDSSMGELGGALTKVEHELTRSNDAARELSLIKPKNLKPEETQKLMAWLGKNWRHALHAIWLTQFKDPTK